MLRSDDNDNSQIQSETLRAFSSVAFCSILGAFLGLPGLLRLRPVATLTAVEIAIRRAFDAGSAELGRLLREDLKQLFASQLSEEESPERHAAIRLVVSESPALLQLELSGSASWQVDGYFALFGQVLCRINVDTLGLLFEKWKERTIGVCLQAGNNLAKAYTESEVHLLGQKLRRVLDPSKVVDVLELMNASTLVTLSKLFPDGKYEVALLQRNFQPFGEAAAGGLLRGKPGECYLSRSAHQVVHLLKTQQDLDSQQLEVYTLQLEDAVASGAARPTALVFDFFTEGEIHKVQPDESPSVVGPGGRRKQRRSGEAENAAWILLDGHHKVEAAARLGCDLNFLIISPCAEPYEPLEADDPCASWMTRKVSFPFMWPYGAEPHAVWEKARFCPHSPMLLSSSKQPEEWLLNSLGCSCFCDDPWFPRWAYEVLTYYDGELGKREIFDLLKTYLGEDHELFTIYFHVEMDDLPDELRARFTSDPSFRHLRPD